MDDKDILIFSKGDLTKFFMAFDMEVKYNIEIKTLIKKGEQK